LNCADHKTCVRTPAFFIFHFFPFLSIRLEKINRVKLVDSWLYHTSLAIFFLSTHIFFLSDHAPGRLASSYQGSAGGRRDIGSGSYGNTITFASMSLRELQTHHGGNFYTRSRERKKGQEERGEGSSGVHPPLSNPSQGEKERGKVDRVYQGQRESEKEGGDMRLSLTSSVEEGTIGVKN